MIRAVEHPVTRAASTHALSLKLITWARITRAVFGHSRAATENDHDPGPGMRECRHHQHRGQERKAEDDVGEPGDDAVDPPAAEIARDQTQKRADRDNRERGGQPDLQRGAGAEDQLAEHVAPARGGAEPVRRGHRQVARDPRSPLSAGPRGSYGASRSAKIAMMTIAA